MLEIKLAFRNILRHKRRSLMTLLAIMTGVIGIVIFGGFVEANYSGLRESVIRSQYGHVQLYAPGYLQNHRKDPAGHRLSPDRVDEYLQLLESDERVLVTTRRLEFTGLLGNAGTSQAAMIRGVDPDSESMINSALTILEGNELTSDDEAGVLLGEGLAQSLDAKVGDELTLLAANDDGVMNAVDVQISGIFRSFAKEYDDRAMMMNIQRAQELLGIDDIDQLVVLLNYTSDLPAFMGALQAGANEHQLPLEFQTWDQMATFYHKVVDLYDGLFVFINIVIIAIVMLSIINTTMVTVMERTQEIGTIRALGTRRFSVTRQFLIECGLLAMISALAGVVVGIALSLYITSLEIMMPAPPGSSQGFPLRIELVPETWLFSVVGVVLVAVLSAYFPAASAARRNIVDALRHV
ncbi:MAG TPA: FtsX-like permease family protein [Cellvibrio sp.]|nr:FtsX-like permease family protein [Cellvibrio sp.]